MSGKVAVEVVGEDLTDAEKEVAQEAAVGAVVAARGRFGPGTCDQCGANVERRPGYDPVMLTAGEPIALEPTPALGQTKTARAQIVPVGDAQEAAVPVGADLEIYLEHRCPEPSP